MTRIDTEHVPAALLSFMEEAADETSDFQDARSAPAAWLVEMPREEICFVTGPYLLCPELGFQIYFVIVFGFIGPGHGLGARTRVPIEETTVHAGDDGRRVVLGEIHAVCGSGGVLLRPPSAVKAFQEPLLGDDVVL
jgi:hypothetical protein